eukprot:TRINITY_DN1414_c2_g1_i2.p1 TRINITY_DN1414_c2_g1~~TRINITY_DN1414_c2_g1_i2.p1  ORF type:complete len:1040 (+),score=351.89 TRINITY_DN1414_c2_g1_i2:91-3120(+)
MEPVEWFDVERIVAIGKRGLPRRLCVDLNENAVAWKSSGYDFDVRHSILDVEKIRSDIVEDPLCFGITINGLSEILFGVRSVEDKRRIDGLLSVLMSRKGEKSRRKGGGGSSEIGGGGMDRSPQRSHQDETHIIPPIVELSSLFYKSLADFGDSSTVPKDQAGAGAGMSASRKGQHGSSVLESSSRRWKDAFDEEEDQMDQMRGRPLWKEGNDTTAIQRKERIPTMDTRRRVPHYAEALVRSSQREAESFLQDIVAKTFQRAVKSVAHDQTCDAVDLESDRLEGYLGVGAFHKGMHMITDMDDLWKERDVEHLVDLVSSLAPQSKRMDVPNTYDASFRSSTLSSNFSDESRTDHATEMTRKTPSSSTHHTGYRAWVPSIYAPDDKFEQREEYDEGDEGEREREFEAGKERGGSGGVRYTSHHSSLIDAKLEKDAMAAPRELPDESASSTPMTSPLRDEHPATTSRLDRKRPSPLQSSTPSGSRGEAMGHLWRDRSQYQYLVDDGYSSSASDHVVESLVVPSSETLSKEESTRTFAKSGRPRVTIQEKEEEIIEKTERKDGEDNDERDDLMRKLNDLEESLSQSLRRLQAPKEPVESPRASDQPDKTPTVQSGDQSEAQVLVGRDRSKSIWEEHVSSLYGAENATIVATDVQQDRTDRKDISEKATEDSKAPAAASEEGRGEESLTGEPLHGPSDSSTPYSERILKQMVEEKKETDMLEKRLREREKEAEKERDLLELTSVEYEVKYGPDAMDEYVKFLQSPDRKYLMGVDMETPEMKKTKTKKRGSLDVRDEDDEYDRIRNELLPPDIRRSELFLGEFDDDDDDMPLPLSSVDMSPSHVHAKRKPKKSVSSSGKTKRKPSPTSAREKRKSSSLRRTQSSQSPSSSREKSQKRDESTLSSSVSIKESTDVPEKRSRKSASQPKSAPSRKPKRQTRGKEGQISSRRITSTSKEEDAEEEREKHVDEGEDEEKDETEEKNISIERTSTKGAPWRREGTFTSSFAITFTVGRR